MVDMNLDSIVKWFQTQFFRLGPSGDWERLVITFGGCTGIIIVKCIYHIFNLISC